MTHVSDTSAVGFEHCRLLWLLWSSFRETLKILRTQLCMLLTRCIAIASLTLHYKVQKWFTRCLKYSGHFFFYFFWKLVSFLSIFKYNICQNVRFYFHNVLLHRDTVSILHNAALKSCMWALSCMCKPILGLCLQSYAFVVLSDGGNASQPNVHSLKYFSFYLFFLQIFCDFQISLHTQAD